MPKRSRISGTDPDNIALSTVEQGTADEVDIQEQIDAASEVDAEAKGPAAESLGRRGGLKGGHARAESLTPGESKDRTR
jgi:hypothetical protein